MNKLVLGLALSVLVSLPVLAALKVGEKAPDFSAHASLAGKEFDFSLQNALKKGPVVVYFYPSAFTKGCDLEAHTFAEMKDQFDAAGATIIGVSADSIARLDQFSADPQYCAGKFPVASDAKGDISSSYNLTKTAVKPDRRMCAASRSTMTSSNAPLSSSAKTAKSSRRLSSKDDGLSPDEHVKKSLTIVQQLSGK